MSAVQQFLRMVTDLQPNGPAALVLRHGHAPSDRVETDLGPMGECFINATHLSRAFGLHYVEGWATTDLGIPLPHAWCEDEWGTLHDPTWADGRDYLGIVIPDDVLSHVLVTTGYYGVLDNLWMMRGEAQQVLDAIAAGQPVRA